MIKSCPPVVSFCRKVMVQSPTATFGHTATPATLMLDVTVMPVNASPVIIPHISIESYVALPMMIALAATDCA